MKSDHNIVKFWIAAFYIRSRDEKSMSDTFLASEEQRNPFA